MGLFILSLHHIGNLKPPLLIESDSLEHKDLDRQAWSCYALCVCAWLCSVFPCVCECERAPSGGQWGDCGALRGDATNLHVGEGAACLTAAVGDGGGGGDDVLQPVQGDDEQRQQEQQQPEEKPHVHVNVGQAPRQRCGSRCGGGGRGESEEGPVVRWRDSSVILVHQRQVRPWHPSWCWGGRNKRVRN